MAAALLAASAAASAAPKRISGNLCKSGYTVVALAANGKARSVRVRRHRFSLRAPAKSVTLHLRSRNGRYAGPIVVRRERRGRRVVVGVRAGARLGRVRVRRGYATSRRLGRKWIDRRWAARARRGVPIGNGRNVGRVRSRGRGGRGLGRDRDLDGVPNLLDIDDDGDRILDRLERPTSASASQSEVTNEFLFKSNLPLELHETANANAAGLTPAQMDAALSGFGELHLNILPGDSAVLDCGSPQSRADPRLGGLVYCTRGGSGKLMTDVPGDPFRGFPDPCCDPDNDGLGSMTPSSPDRAPGAGNLVMFLRHGATSAQIGTGDLLIQRVTRGGLVSDFPGTVQFIFASVPALVSYSDGQGNSATVNYPVTGPNPGPGGPGTRGNGFPVSAAPGGDVVVTLTFWRPQRGPIPPETAAWIDMGGLNYTVQGAIAEVGGCPQGAFSESDPKLRPLERADVHPNDYAGVKDLAADQPANPANTFTYRLNLTRCLAAHGRSFNPGETSAFAFAALPTGGGDGAEQIVSFRRE
ncbi:MAG: hypothetical protein ACRDQB_09130 [Thermocrispum sp.]